MNEKDNNFNAMMALFRKAEKLEGSAAGYTRTPKPGYIKLANGAWCAPDTHDKIVALYTEALALDEPPYLSLYRRASSKMMAGFLDEALADLKLLEERKSVYATGIFPLQLYMLRGDKEMAQRYLDEVNARNKAKGMPKQKFSDFRLD